MSPACCQQMRWHASDPNRERVILPCTACTCKGAGAAATGHAPRRAQWGGVTGSDPRSVTRLRPSTIGTTIGPLPTNNAVEGSCVGATGT